MPQQAVLHEPRLDTILMVERAIQEAQAYPTRRALWLRLPRQVQYQTLQRILAYLESSGKILIDGNRIVWIFPNNPKLKALLASAVKLR